MKKFNATLLVVVFSICFYTAFGQDAPWLEVGSEWVYQHGHVGGPEHFQVKYGITEEVDYLGQTCYKMEQIPFGAGFISCMPIFSDLFFYFADDTLFYATGEMDSFRMAVDFGASAGDSWTFVTGTGEYMDTYSVTVDAASMITIDGYDLRQLNLNYENTSDEPTTYIGESIQMTEVIGSNYAFFVPFGHIAFCDAEVNVQFQCFESPSFSYLSPSYPTCEFVVSTDKLEKASMSLFPNPTSNEVRIELPATLNNRNASLQILNQLGRTVLTRSLDDMTNMSIALDHLSPGLHFVEVSNGKERFVSKLVIE